MAHCFRIDISAGLQSASVELSHHRSVPKPRRAKAVSQLYLAGKGNRSYFDARTIYYLGFSDADAQGQIPIIHPVIDYNYTFDHPVLGGELGYQHQLHKPHPPGGKFRSDYPERAPQRQLHADRRSSGQDSTNCLLRGIPGTYSRFSAETQWRRSITDQFGQVFTPFASVRVDARLHANQGRSPACSNYIDTGDSNLVRAMPTVGLEYRYPFINVQSWGTQTIEPIAQVIVRPNETQVGRWPNEDAQSLIFDDSNLFRVDKFSGWDRVEGGGRANYGVQYTAQFNQGGFVNALFGQSYSLFGQNSFALGGMTNTGLDSGLDTTQSDYVARLSYQPNSTYKFTSRFRFDNDTFTVKRTELEARATFDRWTGACCMATMRLSLNLGSSIAARASWERDWSSSMPTGCLRARPVTTSMPENLIRPARHRLCRRLPHSGPELHYQLHL